MILGARPLVLASCVLLLTAVLAGCGDTVSSPTNGSSSATSLTSTSDTGSVSAPAPTDSGPLAKYKEEMRVWVAKYDADLSEKVVQLGTIDDPLNATQAQIQAAKRFAELMAEAVTSLASIQAPTELASYHRAYVDALTKTSSGMQQFVKAIEERSSSELEVAFGLMSEADNTQQAETALEQALGFALTSN